MLVMQCPSPHSIFTPVHHFGVTGSPAELWPCHIPNFNCGASDLSCTWALQVGLGRVVPVSHAIQVRSSIMQKLGAKRESVQCRVRRSRSPRGRGGPRVPRASCLLWKVLRTTLVQLPRRLPRRSAVPRDPTQMPSVSLAPHSAATVTMHCGS